MASALKNLSTYDENSMPDAQNMKFGIVVSDWNAHITHALYEGAFDTLVKHGANPEKIFTIQVPGAFELPVGARLLEGRDHPDALICLGCVIKGDTDHDKYINQSVASALQSLSIMASKPVVFGLLTVNNEQQALDRCGGKHGNKGVEAAQTAIRMVSLKNVMTKEGKKGIGF